MAYTTINQPTEYFNIVTYTGNGGTDRSITGVGFQPDFVWIKERNTAVSHMIYNSTSGANKRLSSNNNGVEATDSDGLKSFDSDGWTMDAKGSINGSSDTYVAWNFIANGGTTSSNTDGSITSTVQANTTAGFSIVTYTGTGSSATVGHGLGAVPKMLLVKERDNANDWKVYHHIIGNNKTVRLDTTDAETSDTSTFASTTPTSSVFSVNSNATNRSGGGIIAYCFAEKKGYSRIGSYKGNAADNGAFVYTGFKPKFVLIKNITDVADWTMWDTTRYPDNVQNIQLYPNLNNAEDTASSTTRLDMLSTGFKIRGVNNKINGNGDTMIYIAWAENPLVTGTGTPATAR